MRTAPRRAPYPDLVIDLPAPAPGILAEDLDADVCLYRSDTNEVLVLNQTAADIWRLADGTMPIDAIATTLGTAYTNAGAGLRDDVAHLIEDLAQRGYLVDAAATGTPVAGPGARTPGEAETTAL